MKKQRPGGFLILLLGVAAVLCLGSRALEHITTAAFARQVLETEVGGLLRVTEAASAASEAPRSEEAGSLVSGTPQEVEAASAVPVEVVLEAWDESAREVCEADKPAAEATAAPQEEPPADMSPVIDLKNETAYAADTDACQAEAVSLALDTQDPVVLIVHTHGTECYTAGPDESFTPCGNYRTLDPAHSVIAAGDAVAAQLEAAGLGVIHDTTCCDYPDYNGSYAAARENIEAWLTEYPSIQLVLDVHRDAAACADGSQLRTVCTLDGQEMAQVMLVVGSDEGGLSNPDWRDNLTLAVQLQAGLEASAPGICRHLNLRPERFNQDLAPYALLVEVGAAGNTLSEAVAAADRFGEVLAAYLTGQKS